MQDYTQLTIEREAKEAFAQLIFDFYVRALHLYYIKKCQAIKNNTINQKPETSRD
jgi:hypothetical protein